MRESAISERACKNVCMYVSVRLEYAALTVAVAVGTLAPATFTLAATHTAVRETIFQSNKFADSVSPQEASRVCP